MGLPSFATLFEGVAPAAVPANDRSSSSTTVDEDIQEATATVESFEQTMLSLRLRLITFQRYLDVEINTLRDKGDVAILLAVIAEHRQGMEMYAREKEDFIRRNDENKAEWNRASQIISALAVPAGRVIRRLIKRYQKAYVLFLTKSASFEAHVNQLFEEAERAASDFEDVDSKFDDQINQLLNQYPVISDHLAR